MKVRLLVDFRIFFELLSILLGVDEDLLSISSRIVHIYLLEIDRNSEDARSQIEESKT